MIPLIHKRTFIDMHIGFPDSGCVPLDGNCPSECITLDGDLCPICVCKHRQTDTVTTDTPSSTNPPTNAGLSFSLYYLSFHCLILSLSLSLSLCLCLCLCLSVPLSLSLSLSLSPDIYIILKYYRFSLFQFVE